MEISLSQLNKLNEAILIRFQTLDLQNTEWKVLFNNHGEVVTEMSEAKEIIRGDIVWSNAFTELTTREQANVNNAMWDNL